jgi:hypothetical protein
LGNPSEAFYGNNFGIILSKKMLGVYITNTPAPTHTLAMEETTNVMNFFGKVLSKSNFGADVVNSNPYLEDIEDIAENSTGLDDDASGNQIGGVSAMLIVYAILVVYALMVAFRRTGSKDLVPKVMEMVVAFLSPVTYIIVKN